MDVVYGSSGRPEPKPTALQQIIQAGREVSAKAVETVRAVSDSPGAAPLHAFVRQGADEIGQALVAFPANGIQPASEPGQLFEPTAQMVTEQLTGRTSLQDILAAGKEVEQAREQHRGRSLQPER